MGRRVPSEFGVTARLRKHTASLLSVILLVTCGVAVAYKRHRVRRDAASLTAVEPLGPSATEHLGLAAPARPDSQRPRLRRLLAGVAGLLVISGGTIAALQVGGELHLGAPAAAGAASTTVPPVAPTTVPSTTLPPAPLQVLGVRPRPGATAIGFSSDITVRFSAPLAADSPVPKLSPEVPGTWTIEGSRIVFSPRGDFIPLSKLVLTVPAGSSGPEGLFGQSLPSPYSASFTVAGASVLRLQQLLAELNYLPVRFDPAAAAPSGATSSPFVRRLLQGVSGSSGYATPATPSPRQGASAIDDEPTYAGDIARAPLPGSFTWRYADVPASLASLWRPGVDTALVQGAVMAFESDYGLDDNAVLTAAFWADLFEAVASRQVIRAPYDYLEVSTDLPETLSVWQDGSVIFQTPVNTGIPEAPTELGTFPVYARYFSTTMSGFNPDGSYYSDPGIPYVAYFNGGDAVHGFLRAAYGFPQSLGCVELPYAAAEVVFNYDPIGTLVNVG